MFILGNPIPPSTVPKITPFSIIPVSRKNHEGKRCYVIDGDVEYFPSVTTILGCRGKKAIYEWRNRVGEKQANEISKKATGGGTQLHTLCELYLDGEDVNQKAGKVSPEVFHRFRKFIPALSKIDGIYFQEKAVVSKKLQTGGTIDLFGLWENEPAIIDFKTSRRIKKKEDITSYFAQCFAYAQGVYEMYGIKCKKAVILMSYEDSYDIFVEDITYGREFFIESLLMYKKGIID